MIVREASFNGPSIPTGSATEIMAIKLSKARDDLFNTGHTVLYRFYLSGEYPCRVTDEYGYELFVGDVYESLKWVQAIKEISEAGEFNDHGHY